MNKKPSLDVVVIATIRGEVLDATLCSFHHRILRHFDVRLIVNIDPIGETDRATQQDMLDICKKYFDDVVVNMPTTPSFSQAVKWGWEQVRTPIFFHLEDDWLCLKDIPYEDALARFEDENVVEVFFHKGAASDVPPYSHHKDYEFFPYMSLNPCFLRTAYVKELVARFDTAKDPEGQFCYPFGGTASFAMPFYLRFSEEKQILDIGTRWRRGERIERNYNDGDPNTSLCLWYVRPLSAHRKLKRVYKRLLFSSWLKRLKKRYCEFKDE